MSTSINDITGDRISTSSNTDKYKDGWERIFGKKKQESEPAKDEDIKDSSEESLNKLSK